MQSSVNFNQHVDRLRRFSCGKGCQFQMAKMIRHDSDAMFLCQLDQQIGVCAARDG